MLNVAPNLAAAGLYFFITTYGGDGFNNLQGKSIVADLTLVYVAIYFVAWLWPAAKPPVTRAHLPDATWIEWQQCALPLVTARRWWWRRRWRWRRRRWRCVGLCSIWLLRVTSQQSKGCNSLLLRASYAQAMPSVFFVGLRAASQAVVAVVAAAAPTAQAPRRAPPCELTVTAMTTSTSHVIHRTTSQLAAPTDERTCGTGGTWYQRKVLMCRACWCHCEGTFVTWWLQYIAGVANVHVLFKPLARA